MSSSPATEPDLDSQVATDPRTGRPAGALQGGILLACACMAVLAAVLMSPNLPRIQQASAPTPPGCRR